MTMQVTADMLNEEIANRKLEKYASSNSVALNQGIGEDIELLYYDNSQTKVELMEIECNLGRYTQSGSSVQFSSTTSVNLQNDSFIGSLFVTATLPDFADVNMCLPRGWLYSAIDFLEITYGSVNQSNLVLDGHSLFQTVMAQCLTKEKRDRVLKLGGEEKLTPDGNQAVASVFIPVAFSSLQGMTLGHKKPVSGTLVRVPIQVKLKIKPASSWIRGSSVNKPTQFDSIEFVTRQIVPTNRGLTLDRSLAKFDLDYKYPFLQRYTQHIVQSSSGNRLRVKIDSITSGDLLGIYVGVVKSTDVSNQNIFRYTPLSNIRLLWNGTVLVNAPNNLHLLAQMNQINGDCSYGNSIILPGANAPYLSIPENNDFFIWDNTMVRQENFMQVFQNAPNYSSQNLQFEADVNEADVEYQVYVTYILNALWSISARDGRATIVTN